MGRSVLPCFRRSPCPLLSTQEASAFCSSLSEDIRRLEQSLVDGPISLRWSVEAMNLLKKMQIELLALFKKSKLPISFGAEEDWFNQYMRETATLLDFCNSLKSAVSGINHHRMVIDLAIQNFTEDGSLSTVAALDGAESERLEKKLLNAGLMRETVRVGGRIGFEGVNTNDHQSIASVMLASKITMIVVSLLLVSAIVSPLPINIGSGELTYDEFPQLKPFVDVLTALVVRFRERVAKPKIGSSLVLAEHEIVDRVVGDLKDQMVKGERILSGVELLRTSCVGLREGIEMFDAVVDEVFEVVIRGRNEMLGMLRDGALSVG